MMVVGDDGTTNANEAARRGRRGGGGGAPRLASTTTTKTSGMRGSSRWKRIGSSRRAWGGCDGGAMVVVSPEEGQSESISDER